MFDANNLVLTIFFIFIITMGLIIFFNIVLRYVGKLSRKDIVLMAIATFAIVFLTMNLFYFSGNYADSRNAQRSSDVNIILDAVSEFTTVYPYNLDRVGEVPACPAVKKIGSGTGNIDLANKLGQGYLLEIPVDPEVGNVSDTGYTICLSASGRVVIDAPFAENNRIITARK
jgi:hypothetical protein